MTVETLVDIIGWTGAGCLLLAYWLVSSTGLPGRSWRYQLLNITGAILLSVNSAYHGAFPSVGLNAVWIVVGLMTLRALRAMPTEPLDRGH
ncbi:MAG: hypothetical protein WD081_05950 [Gammaproteobacteria bacterium]